MMRVIRLTALFCGLALLLTLISSASAAESPAMTNINWQNYENWANPITSYLYGNASGGLTRVQTGTSYSARIIGEYILIEEYDSSYNLINSQKIEPGYATTPWGPLPMDRWGGFFAGKEYLFLIFGCQNVGNNDTQEVMRVVKYSKNWEPLGQASVYGSNIQEAFTAGSLRCAEYGGYLYIHASYDMYNGHQANMMFQIKQSDMTVADSYTKVGRGDGSDGYAAHSFNQFILVDQNQNIITLNHGDAYPRAIVLSKYGAKAGEAKFQSQCTVSIIQAIPGELGQNFTGASVGGLEETATGYVTAYSYDGTGITDYVNQNPRYIYLAYTSKDGLKTTTKKISTAGGSTPVLVSTGLSGGYVMWNGCSSGIKPNDTLYYAAYSADGSVGPVQTATAPLSDCKPIIYNGRLVWYVTNNSAPVFYGLDGSGVQKLDASSGVSKAPVTGSTPAPAAPAAPAVPTVGGFSDVPAMSPYADAIVWAAGQGITSGKTATTFAPSEDCTNGQILTFLWRASGSPEPAIENPFLDDIPNSFQKAAVWAYEKGLVTGSTFGASTPCTRAMTVTYLWRAAGSPAPGGSAGFEDVPSGAAYSQAVAWAVENGVTSGTSATAFSPDQTCTRGQIVTFLYRAYAA